MTFTDLKMNAPWLTGTYRKIPYNHLKSLTALIYDYPLKSFQRGDFFARNRILPCNIILNVRV